MSDTQTSLLERLEAKRKLLDLNKKTFSKAIGTDNSTYCHALSGRHGLPKHTERKIAKLLGLSLAEVKALREGTKGRMIKDRMLSAMDLSYMADAAAKLGRELPISLLLSILDVERKRS